MCSVSVSVSWILFNVQPTNTHPPADRQGNLKWRQQRARESKNRPNLFRGLDTQTDLPCAVRAGKCDTLHRVARLLVLNENKYNFNIIMVLIALFYAFQHTHYPPFTQLLHDH